jgi:pre-mRNA-splicing factor ATP-dependent RNA helicase DHX38/PRP16
MFSCTAEAEAQAKQANKEDYKGDSKFASHLKLSAGVSAFAKNRTLKEQREFLPAFACREDLMRIIRDNQGVFFLGILTCQSRPWIDFSHCRCW